MSDGILGRWSRRKRAVQEAERPRRDAVADPVADAPPLPPESETPEEADALAEAIARLPKLEDLTAQTDLAPFLRTGIPSALRNAALRRMWSVDPGIRDFVSEAREYAYDWNTPGGVPGLGPMLPTDDIKAMVERVMTGSAPRPDPAASVAATDDPASEPPPVSAEAAAETEPPAPKGDVAVAAAIPHVEGANPIPAMAPAAPFQSPAIVSRLRRHGGALPS